MTKADGLHRFCENVTTARNIFSLLSSFPSNNKGNHGMNTYVRVHFGCIVYASDALQPQKCEAGRVNPHV